eukprot:574086-Pelagomonas_calceolata.AAC.1
MSLYLPIHGHIDLGHHPALLAETWDESSSDTHSYLLELRSRLAHPCRWKKFAPHQRALSLPACKERARLGSMCAGNHRPAVTCGCAGSAARTHRAGRQGGARQQRAAGTPGCLARDGGGNAVFI